MGFFFFAFSLVMASEVAFFSPGFFLFKSGRALRNIPWQLRSIHRRRCCCCYSLNTIACPNALHSKAVDDTHRWGKLQDRSNVEGASLVEKPNNLWINSLFFYKNKKKTHQQRVRNSETFQFEFVVSLVNSAHPRCSKEPGFQSITVTDKCLAGAPWLGEIERCLGPAEVEINHAAASYYETHVTFLWLH